MKVGPGSRLNGSPGDMKAEAAVRLWPFVFLLLEAGWGDGEHAKRAYGTWAVKVAGGDSAMADSVAHAAGLRNSGLLDPFNDVFVFEGGEEETEGGREGGRKVAKREVLYSHSAVVWVSQQQPLRRVKRAFLPFTEVGSSLPRRQVTLYVFNFSPVFHQLRLLRVWTTSLTSPPQLETAPPQQLLSQCLTIQCFLPSGTL